MEKESRRNAYNTYMREYNLRRYRRLRGEAISYLGRRCVKCGSGERLELDHINRLDKELDVSKMLSFTLKKFGLIR